MSPKRSTRLVVAEPLRLLCEGICSLLQGEQDFHVLGCTQLGDEVMSLVGRLEPNILLLAMDTPGVSCLDILRELTSKAPRTRTIVLANDPQRPRCMQALEYGARGVLAKDSPKEILFKSIRCVMAGEYWVGREQMATLFQYLRDYKRKGDGEAHLTWRESEIVSAILAGSSNKDIANRLSISEETVKHHVTNVFRKLKVSNRLELALHAAHTGLLAQLMTPAGANRD